MNAPHISSAVWAKAAPPQALAAIGFALAGLTITGRLLSIITGNAVSIVALVVLFGLALVTLVVGRTSAPDDSIPTDALAAATGKRRLTFARRVGMSQLGIGLALVAFGDGWLPLS